jgi:uncharacterized protein YlxW (UPF0749 family)
VRSEGRGRDQGLLLPAVLLVLGFLVSAAVAQERAQEERLPEQTADLARLVRRREAAIRDLSAQVGQLSDELAGVQEAGARESSRVRAVLVRVERLRRPVGLAPLHGPGVVVELADSPEAPRTTGDVTDLRIQDVDLQLVVNALWSAGAEAVAVNDRRVTSTTAIRAAGEAILVNFHAVSSPYRVEAIGDADALRRGTIGSEIARQFEVWTQIYGLGFTIRSPERVTVPALPAAHEVAWARPAGGPE